LELFGITTPEFLVKNGDEYKLLERSCFGELVSKLVPDLVLFIREKEQKSQPISPAPLPLSRFDLCFKKVGSDLSEQLTDLEPHLSLNLLLADQEYNTLFEEGILSTLELQFPVEFLKISAQTRAGELVPLTDDEKNQPLQRVLQLDLTLYLKSNLSLLDCFSTVNHEKVSLQVTRSQTVSDLRTALAKNSQKDIKHVRLAVEKNNTKVLLSLAMDSSCVEAIYGTNDKIWFSFFEDKEEVFFATATPPCPPLVVGKNPVFDLIFRLNNRSYLFRFQDEQLTVQQVYDFISRDVGFDSRDQLIKQCNSRKEGKGLFLPKDQKATGYLDIEFVVKKQAK